MDSGVVSRRMAAVSEVVAPVWRFFTQSSWTKKVGDPAMCDFTFGNPHEMPLPGFVEALSRWIVPQNKDWYAYKDNEPGRARSSPPPCACGAELPFADEDIFLTNGAFAALAVALRALVDPGDEVIFISPPWFFYEALIVGAGREPVRVKVDPETFDLDLEAIEAAITPRTRAIIVNSPHNPTGKIYPPDTLTPAGRTADERSERNGRAIYLLSDEAYSRIVFDGRHFPSPAAFYPHSFVLYTYGKTLLTPGQRIGYIALSPNMPDREIISEAIFGAQTMTGFAFPNALLQHALPDLEQLSIDMEHMHYKRDRVVGALRDMGYEPAHAGGDLLSAGEVALGRRCGVCGAFGLA